MTPRTAWLGAALVLAAAAALGYRSGLGGDAGVGHVSGSDIASPTPATESEHGKIADAPKDAVVRTVAPSLALPDDLLTLGGEAFLAALPELERRAHGGDMTALLVIYRQFTGCVGYEPRPDSEIRKRADESYERFKDIERDARARNPEWKLPPGISTPEESHAHALDTAFDRRTVCTALTPADLEGRFAWATAALEQHDRRMILELAGPGRLQVDRSELVRNAERLVELQEIERIEIERLIGIGDMDVIARAASGASNQYMPSLVRYDPVRAWALARAWQLANPGEDTRGMQRLIDRLEDNGLASDQIEQAQLQADALYRRCCAQPDSAD